MTLYEIMNPAELLDDALRLNLIALERHSVAIDAEPLNVDGRRESARICHTFTGPVSYK